LGIRWRVDDPVVEYFSDRHGEEGRPRLSCALRCCWITGGGGVEEDDGLSSTAAVWCDILTCSEASVDPSVMTIASIGREVFLLSDDYYTEVTCLIKQAGFGSPWEVRISNTDRPSSQMVNRKMVLS
jgi:hypothetical protein